MEGHHAAFLEYPMNGALTHLFETNDPPSESESVQLTTLVHDLEIKMSNLAARPDRIDQLQRLNLLLVSAKAIMSPIRRLPCEVVSQIISECVPTENGRPWNSLDPQKAPWTLTQVCKLWHEAGLSDQRFWSSLDFDAYWQSLPINSEPLGASKLMLTCLARSGQRLLAIRASKGVNHHLLRQLLPYSERWASLAIQINHTHVEIFELIKYQIPELFEVDLNFQGIPETSPYFDFLQVAPKLRKIEMAYLPRWIPTSHPERILPWHQLASLRIRTDAIQVLPHCHQLVNCVLTRSDHVAAGGTPDVDLPIFLPNLQKLAVSSPDILDMLTLPSLKSLLIGPIHYRDILSLISRSGCALKTLTVTRASKYRQGELQNLLASCSDLRTLVVNKSGGMGIILPTGWYMDAPHSDSFITYKRDSSA